MTDYRQAIADMSPLESYAGCCDGGTRCYFCGSEYEPHTASCLWLQANVELGRSVPADQNVNESDADYAQRKTRDADIAAHGPIAPRQDVPTVMEMAISNMAAIFQRDIFASFQRSAPLSGLSAAVVGGA